MSTAQRQSSTISRCVESGRAIYRKQYVTDNWGGDSNVIRKRAQREIGLLNLVSQSRLFGRRFGVMKIAESNPEMATIATFEIPGMTLEQWVHLPRNRQIFMPWFLAGGWLKRLQQLPLSETALEVFSNQNKGSLIEYCATRLNSLADFGYQWPDLKTKTKILDSLSPLSNRQKVWVHADYAPGNLMWGDGVLTPIDFAMARAGHPLEDASYLIHRLEMAQVYRPWLGLPLSRFRSAILRGLGRENAETLRDYQTLKMKHLICRLHTYVRRPSRNLKQSLHDKWVRRVVRHQIVSIANRSGEN